MVEGFVEHNETLGHRLNLEEHAEYAIERQKMKMCSNNIDELNLNDTSSAAIKKFYKSVKTGELDMDNVERLLVETTPALGFDSSAVYLLEPNTGRLVARFKLTDYGNVVDKTVVLTEAQMLQMVQIALDSPAAIVREFRYGGRKVYSNIAERFGEGAIQGVLFVQGGENLGNSGVSSERLARFQAIRRALCDCLNISHLNT